MYIVTCVAHADAVSLALLHMKRGRHNIPRHRVKGHSNRTRNNFNCSVANSALEVETALTGVHTYITVLCIRLYGRMVFNGEPLKLASDVQFDSNCR
jgi:hypothetical protein